MTDTPRWDSNKYEQVDLDLNMMWTGPAPGGREAKDKLADTP